jgi:hypothetical protein
VGPGVVRLRIVSTAETYRFSYAVGDEAFQQLGEVETRYLSSEVADGFTGVFVGMFATGNGKDSAASADFDWFEYKRMAKRTSSVRMNVRQLAHRANRRCYSAPPPDVRKGSAFPAVVFIDSAGGEAPPRRLR